MPQVQVVDTTENQPEPTGLENFFSKLGKSYKDDSDRVQIGSLINEYKENRQNANAWEDLQLGLESSTISPTKRLETQRSLNEMRKQITERDKSLNAQVKKGMKTEEERQSELQRLVNDGYPEEEAQIYVDSPPSVKSSLERNHRMEKARGIRKTPTQKESPAVQDQQLTPTPEAELVEGAPEVAAAQEKAAIEEDVWPELPPPPNMTHEEKIKWGNNNEKSNIKELKEVEKKKKAYRDNGILISSLTKGNESKKLPSGLGKLVVIDPDTGDIRPSAQLAGQINPETELYIKNLKQFLKGAKDFFGARVTNFDVSSFMQQLPSLLNSDQGRRVILKQMQLVNDLESVHANELDEGIKHYGRNANYIDISRTVDEKVANKEKALLNKIDNVVDASKELEKMSKNPEKFKGSVLMQTDKGEWKAVKKELVEKYETKGWSVY